MASLLIFYEAFSDILASKLFIVFQDALKKHSMPESKNPQKCGSYRPVSLINVNAKILAKIFASRLEKYLPSLIHLDQVFFLKGRSSPDSVCRLLHLIWHTRNNTEPIVAFSLDAECLIEWSGGVYLGYQFGLG